MNDYAALRIQGTPDNRQPMNDYAALRIQGTPDNPQQKHYFQCLFTK